MLPPHHPEQSKDTEKNGLKEVPGTRQSGTLDMLRTSPLEVTLRPSHSANQHSNKVSASQASSGIPSRFPLTAESPLPGTFSSSSLVEVPHPPPTEEHVFFDVSLSTGSASGFSLEAPNGATPSSHVQPLEREPSSLLRSLQKSGVQTPCDPILPAVSSDAYVLPTSSDPDSTPKNSSWSTPTSPAQSGRGVSRVSRMESPSLIQALRILGSSLLEDRTNRGAQPPQHPPEGIEEATRGSPRTLLVSPVRNTRAALGLGNRSEGSRAGFSSPEDSVLGSIKGDQRRMHVALSPLHPRKSPVLGNDPKGGAVGMRGASELSKPSTKTLKTTQGEGSASFRLPPGRSFVCENSLYSLRSAASLSEPHIPRKGRRNNGWELSVPSFYGNYSKQCMIGSKGQREAVYLGNFSPFDTNGALSAQTSRYRRKVPTQSEDGSERIQRKLSDPFWDDSPMEILPQLQPNPASAHEGVELWPSSRSSQRFSSPERDRQSSVASLVRADSKSFLASPMLVGCEPLPSKSHNGSAEGSPSRSASFLRREGLAADRFSVGDTSLATEPPSSASLDGSSPALEQTLHGAVRGSLSHVEPFLQSSTDTFSPSSDIGSSVDHGKPHLEHSSVDELVALSATSGAGGVSWPLELVNSSSLHHSSRPLGEGLAKTSVYTVNGTSHEGDAAAEASRHSRRSDDKTEEVSALERIWRAHVPPSRPIEGKESSADDGIPLYPTPSSGRLETLSIDDARPPSINTGDSSWLARQGKGADTVMSAAELLEPPEILAVDQDSLESVSSQSKKPPLYLTRSEQERIPSVSPSFVPKMKTGTGLKSRSSSNQSSYSEFRRSGPAKPENPSLASPNFLSCGSFVSSFTGSTRLSKMRIQMASLNRPAFDMSKVEEMQNKEMEVDGCRLELSAGAAVVHPITQINPFIFLGSWKDAQNTELLRRHNIRYILNLAEELETASTDLSVVMSPASEAASSRPIHSFGNPSVNPCEDREVARISSEAKVNTAASASSLDGTRLFSAKDSSETVFSQERQNGESCGKEESALNPVQCDPEPNGSPAAFQAWAGAFVADATPTVERLTVGMSDSHRQNILESAKTAFHFINRAASEYEAAMWKVASQANDEQGGGLLRGYSKESLLSLTPLLSTAFSNPTEERRDSLRSPSEEVPMHRSSQSSDVALSLSMPMGSSPSNTHLGELPSTSSEEPSMPSFGCVLVHCRRGISRSAAVVVGYLMASEGLSYDEALQHVSSQRSCVSLNLGFRQNLSGFQPEPYWRRPRIGVAHAIHALCRRVVQPRQTGEGDGASEMLCHPRGSQTSNSLCCVEGSPFVSNWRKSSLERYPGSPSF